MTDLVIRSSSSGNTHDNQVCFSIGCRSRVATKENGTAATRCQLHLDQQAVKQKAYRRRASHKASTEKDRVTALVAENQQLMQQLKEATVKAKLYDELKHRYETLKLAYANNVPQK